jgi:hypothetical protein
MTAASASLQSGDERMTSNTASEPGDEVVRAACIAAAALPAAKPSAIVAASAARATDPARSVSHARCVAAKPKTALRTQQIIGL